jgi:sugar lactone lactonase YvrE
LRIGAKLTPAKYIQRIPEQHRAHHILPTPSGPQRCAIISSEGILALTHHRKRRIDQQVRAWAGREVKHHVLEPARQDPAGSGMRPV